MVRRLVKTTAIALSSVLLCSGMTLQVQASGVSSVLPSGGINIALSKGIDLETIHADGKGNVAYLESLVELEEIQKAQSKDVTEVAPKEESLDDVAISIANDYVTIRNTPDQKGKALGKLYRNCAGRILSETDGWYEITSGSVTGFVKAEYCAVGEEALILAKEVGNRMARVQCDRLLVRKDAKVDGAVLGMVAMDDELTILEENEDWVKVDIEEGFGWVSREFVTIYTEFAEAESKEEEAVRLQKEAEERRKNRTEEAINMVVNIPMSDGNEMGAAVVEYAVQFVGNPYVYGGTSLTEGADCSGFVMKVYEQFGVSLPHSSSADRKQGYAVDGLENAKPGDLICYSGHVAIYMGDGMIVHASNAKDGIKISKASYRKILAVRRIF